jgi:biotin transport system substrate-specific component
MAAEPLRPTLASALWPSSGDTAALIRALLLALAGTALLTLSAKLKVPFYPVPMTMQTLVVLVIGATYGARLGAATVALYLLQGALGLPVFADTPERGLGLPYMMGPTGGYLVGFVIAAYAVGWLAQRGWDRSIPLTLGLMVLGHVIIFAAGFGWLASSIGMQKAWLLGVVPFAAGTLLKTALGTALVPALWSLAPRRA